MISESEYLERVVAGIQILTSDGATVVWSEKINGRQFDVVVRFRLGLVDYLVLLEVKNKSRPASASDIEAFATKTSDHFANKAIFVSSAGFQDGARQVASRHGIDLFTIEFVPEDWSLPREATLLLMKQGRDSFPSSLPKVEVGEPVLVANFDRVILVYHNGRSSSLPSEQSQMNYYANKSKLSDGRTIADVLRSQTIIGLNLDERRDDRIELEENTRIFTPDNYCISSGPLKAIEYSVVGSLARPLLGNTLIEPNMFSCPVEYTNALTGEKTRFSESELPLGEDKLVAGQYYFTVHPLSYFYCKQAGRDSTVLYMIESFQNCNLVTAVVKPIDAGFSRRYLRVTDQPTRTRLNGRLDDFVNSRPANLA